jgi:hypothetical protein
MDTPTTPDGFPALVSGTSRDVAAVAGRHAYAVRLMRVPRTERSPPDRP